MNGRTLALLAAAWLPLAACSGPATTPAGAPQPTAAALATITADDFYSRISILAADSMHGRDTPSRGLDAAAGYLVSEYRRLGLEPAGEDGYYQWYPFPMLGLDTTTVHFGTVAGGENVMLRYAEDFYVAPVEGGIPGGGDMNHARLLYVGMLMNGSLPAGDYEGAAPMVLIPGGAGRDWNIAVNRARAEARAAGATALVAVASHEYATAAFQRMAQQARVPRRRIPAADEIPVIYLTARAAAQVAERAGVTLSELPHEPASPIELEGVDAHFAASAVRIDEGRAPNVAAVLRGSDPALRDEYVVLSAHMDHVGVGAPVNGDSIYNGADDNASGTTALIEIAEALASMPEPPARSIIFLHVSGEEHGLLGSRWYSDHPTVPLERIVANINIDMIARNAPDSVVVIGKDYSSLGDVVNEVGASHPELRLTASDDIWPEERFFFRSDHFNFARKEIPSIFFFSGVHEDYHRPSDEVDTLDMDKAARVSRMVLQTLRRIADDPQRPVWDPEGLEEVRALTR